MTDKMMINGEEWVRASGAQEWPETTRAIVVVDRGWIFAGDVEDVDGRVRIHNAVWVFRWESVGFSGIVADPSKADLRTLTAPVDMPAGAEIFRVPVHAEWGR